MLKASTTKSPLQRVDVSSKTVARHWSKRFKKPASEIEAAVAKVGDNPETVMKQLGLEKEVQV
jgi:hypothetical protein